MVGADGDPARDADAGQHAARAHDKARPPDDARLEPPGRIEIANRAARVAAELVGGDPGSSINEVVLGTPTTAHILGGACVGGVVDRYHRVTGAPGLHVLDGAAVNANLGVNPSLTITAQAERACSLWPNAGDDDPRPPRGSDDVDVERVTPTRPAVPASAPAALRP